MQGNAGLLLSQVFSVRRNEDNSEGLVSYPDNKSIVVTSNDDEVEVVSCRDMIHRYDMLSYFTESCPTDPVELETDWHTTMNTLGLVGVDLSGLCGADVTLV